jgi:hypothetical protein
MIRLLSVALAAVILSGCTTASQARAGRPVTSQYRGWTLAVTPSSSDSGAWRARVRAWPTDVDPRSHGGIALRFTESAASERAIVAAALAFARSYVDGSTLEPGAAAPAASEPRPGRAVIGEHHGWTLRITPLASASGDGEWRAGVEVWPPDRSPESHSGIHLRFTDVASDEKSIVESAMRSARRYIDASRTQHR